MNRLHRRMTVWYINVLLFYDCESVFKRFTVICFLRSTFQPFFLLCYDFGYEYCGTDDYKNSYSECFSDEISIKIEIN